MAVLKEITSFRRLGLAALIALAGTLPLSAATLEKPDVSIAVGGKVALYYLPLTIADVKGYFKEEGLNVKILDFQGGSKSVQAVVGGSADILESAYEHTINLQARGQEIQVFALQGRYPGFVLSVSKELAKTYKGVADLKGKKVGVTAPGSSTNAMLNVLLKKNGISPADVPVIGVGAGASVLASMANGQIDATVQADPATTLLVQAGDAVVKVDTRTAEGTEAVYGGPMPAASFSALRSFIDKNPNTIQALTNAMVKALHFLATASDEEIFAALPKEMVLGGDKATYLKMIAAVRPSYSPDGRMTQKAAETALATLRSDNPAVAAATIDLAKTYTNAFIDKAPKGK